MLSIELREKTSLQHQQLETNPLLRLLTSEEITIQSYLTILHKFYGFFFPLETAIEANSTLISTLLPDFNERRKVSSLKTDIETLGSSVANCQNCLHLPSVASTAQIVGCLYVMEGSTLGGSVISRHLEKKLNISAINGAKFFNGYGKETGPKWKVFQQAINEYPATKSEVSEIISSANECFEKLHQWMKD